MRAAVIDVGSNSIKLLVADRGSGGEIVEVFSRTLEVRIGSGIGSDRPSLGPEGMERGVAAIAALVFEARGLAAGLVSAVATSAVRDASNGEEFRGLVRSATGIELRILSGLEEADGIGRGLTTDPALGDLADFNVYDLGGGSLECLCFHQRRVERAVSLPLGCVRLTERFVRSPSLPLGDAEASAIRRHVEEVLSASGFPVAVPPGVAVVGTGGTLTTARAILASAAGASLEQSPALVSVVQLRQLLASVASADLAGRRAVPALPPGRADVFPTALVTLLAVADAGGISGYRHSLRNLRWGLAAELLS